jgi:glutamyl-tRNA synthetase
MIRVRFAPSPTGSLHVGGARTALFNWLFVQHARRMGDAAAFVLRIEDTDKERSTDAYTQVILDGMRWLGLSWDEGPFFQAGGLERHRADADRLVAEGKAYIDEGAVRFRVNHEDIAWDDAVHGRIAFHGKDLEDFIILRADRTPVYNFAVVSDDIAMAITHVFRGDDHISNTPKQILLYRALGAEPPVFGHVPMIHGADGKKLSKRHGATAVADYEQRHILPMAMVNFLALLGWSPGGDRELFFEMSELIDAFSFAKVLSKAAVFDERKLAWMNAEHLKHRAKSSPDWLYGEAKQADPRLATQPRERVMATLAAVLERSNNVADVVRQAGVRLGLDPAQPDEKAAAFIAKDEPGYRKSLALVAAALAGFSDWTAAGLEAELRRIAEANGLKAGAVMQPVRIALTGATVSEPVNELLVAVGKDAALERLRAAAGWA